MSFTEIIRRHLPDHSNQKAIAMEWLERRQKSGAPTRAASYVESRFSRCLSGEPAAVRFFFESRESAATLMDVMGVPAEARDELLAAADRHITDGPPLPPVRMVIDLSSWSDTPSPQVLYEALRELVSQPTLVKPAALVITPRLHDALPRSFDKIDWLRVEVADPEEAETQVKALISAGALLVSPTQPAEVARWLAMDFDAKVGRLMLEPTDGLARFGREGTIALPPVEHSLAACIADLPAATWAPPPMSGTALRRLLAQLRTESDAAAVHKDPSVRLAMARALGIDATSTARERVDSELRTAAAELGRAAPAVSRAELDALLARARRRPAPPTLRRVGDELHFINPPDGQSGLQRPRVKVHRVAAPEPLIARLREAIADWTLGDFEADPFLERVLEALAPDGRDQLALLHARAWLLALGAVKPAPGDVVADWRPALAALLSGDVPPAMLRLANTGSHRSSFVAADPRPWFAAPLDGIDEDAASRLRHVSSPLDAVPATRNRDLQLFNAHGDGPITLRKLGSRGAVGGDASTDDAWLDAYDAFAAEQGRSLSPVYGMDETRLKDLPWKEADLVAATTWLVLRTALASNVAVRAYDGTVTLSIGGGLAAVIATTQTAHAHAPRVMLDYDANDHTRDFRGHHGLLSTIRTGVDSTAFAVPTRVVLCGGVVRAEVTFIASPLLLGGPAADLTLRAAKHADEDAHADADDDDD